MNIGLVVDMSNFEIKAGRNRDTREIRVFPRSKNNVEFESGRTDKLLERREE